MQNQEQPSYVSQITCLNILLKKVNNSSICLVTTLHANLEIQVIYCHRTPGVQAANWPLHFNSLGDLKRHFWINLYKN